MQRDDDSLYNFNEGKNNTSGNYKIMKSEKPKQPYLVQTQRQEQSPTKHSKNMAA